MIKPFEPDQVKTFRAPKYTGITLSLLSMFVLTAMFAVWNKVSNPQNLQILLTISSSIMIILLVYPAYIFDNFILSISL